MKLNIVLLAAGHSRRFGKHKLLYYVNGYPMYMHAVWSVLKLMQTAGGQVQNVSLVARSESMIAAMKGYPIETIYNKDSALGISTSIKLGVEANKNGDGYLFFVCDQPYFTDKSLAGLVSLSQQQPDSIVTVSCQGRLGNPCIFPAKYRDELLHLTGDSGGRQIIKRRLAEVVQYDLADARELIDIDYFEEL